MRRQRRLAVLLKQQVQPLHEQRVLRPPRCVRNLTELIVHDRWQAQRQGAGIAAGGRSGFWSRQRAFFVIASARLFGFLVITVSVRLRAIGVQFRLLPSSRARTR